MQLGVKRGSRTRVERGIAVVTFLREHPYIDFSALIIRAKAWELFSGRRDDVEKARAAYAFVRDEIPHTFDIRSDIITAKASDVLERKTGICHAKANLLAALLRSQGIPTGFCFQRLTLLDDDSKGYVVHCLNAIFLGGRWIKADARGNRPGSVNAQFSLDSPVLAFSCRAGYDEYFWPGVYSEPHEETMRALEKAKGLQDVLDTLPDTIAKPPDAV